MEYDRRVIERSRGVGEVYKRKIHDAFDIWVDRMPAKSDTFNSCGGR